MTVVQCSVCSDLGFAVWVHQLLAALRSQVSTLTVTGRPILCCFQNFIQTRRLLP